MKRLLLLVVLTVVGNLAWASISCPKAVTISCHTEINNLNITGKASVHSGVPRYYDDVTNTSCFHGTIKRTWYADKNGNRKHDVNLEVSCVQIITVTDVSDEIYIEYPRDTTLSCYEYVPKVPPIIHHNPCMKVGYSIDVDTFHIVEGACLKIFHNYEILDWCTGRKWKHKRIIKIVNDDKPVFDTCEDVTIGTNEGCRAKVVLTQSAKDTGNCPSDELSWWAHVDLDSDGKVDYVFDKSQKGAYKTTSFKSGDKFELALPNLVDIGKHKVHWSVADGCGNITSCYSTFEVKDLKPPTPYCINFVSAAFDGKYGPLLMRADMCDRGSFDNCTPQEELRFSFSSNVNDTIKSIDCGQEGFQFLRIYVTDEYGNQDYCEVYALVFDNGSCDGSFAPEGSVRMLGMNTEYPEIGVYKNDTLIAMTGSDDGSYLFDSIGLYQDYTIRPVSQGTNTTEVSLHDVVALEKLLSEETVSDMDQIIGDVNHDGKLDSLDVENLKIRLTERDAFEEIMVPGLPAELAPFLKTRSTEIPLRHYRGSFNYTAAVEGNLYYNSYEKVKVPMLVTHAGNDLIVSNLESIDVAAFRTSGKNEMIDSLGYFFTSDLSTMQEDEFVITFDASQQKGIDLNAFINDQIEIIGDSIQYELEAITLTDVDKDIEARFDVSPNPFKDQLVIKGKEIDRVEVYTIEGKVIESASYKSIDSVTLDASEWNHQGMLLITVTSKGKLETRRVVRH